MVRVALGQFDAVVGDLTGNSEKMRNVYAQAAASEADLLVFPELSMCGYPPEDLLYKKHFLKDTRRAIERLAVDFPDVTIVGGFTEEYDGKVKFVKLNTDENPAIAGQFGIRSIPTLLVFKGGETVGQIVGFRPKGELAKRLDEALA